jgi:hypothetical protein
MTSRLADTESRNLTYQTALGDILLKAEERRAAALTSEKKAAILETANKALLEYGPAAIEQLLKSTKTTELLALNAKLADEDRLLLLGVHEEIKDPKAKEMYLSLLRAGGMGEVIREVANGQS